MPDTETTEAVHSVIGRCGHPITFPLIADLTRSDLLAIEEQVKTLRCVPCLQEEATHA